MAKTEPRKGSALWEYLNWICRNRSLEPRRTKQCSVANLASSSTSPVGTEIHPLPATVVEVLEKTRALDQILYDSVRLINTWTKYLIRIAVNPNRAKTYGLCAYDIPPVAGSQPDTACLRANPASKISQRTRNEAVISPRNGWAISCRP